MTTLAQKTSLFSERAVLYLFIALVVLTGVSTAVSFVNLVGAAVGNPDSLYRGLIAFVMMTLFGGVALIVIGLAEEAKATTGFGILFSAASVVMIGTGLVVNYA